MSFQEHPLARLAADRQRERAELLMEIHAEYERRRATARGRMLLWLLRKLT